ncbi:MAG TPA: hypothetical protein PLR27_00795 [Methanoregulaceae archaeon]|nr:hypothetical protein [Methanoregulaceae archaeon]
MIPMSENNASIADIFGVGTLDLIEPSFADLPDNRFTALLMECDGDQGRLLIDQESDPIAVAVHSMDGRWIAGCCHLRRPTASLIAFFEDMGGDIYQEERQAWEEAVREYYSLRIAAEVTPAFEDLNPERTALVQELLMENLGPGNGQTCLDFCCGSGLGSAVLRGMGYRILSCDIDLSLLSLGFSTGRLVPRETMHIDATLAHHYIGRAGIGLGLMFGEINEFNADTWEILTRELVMLTDRCLITVGKEAEANRILAWAQACDRTVEISENTRDPIYDRWVCTIKGESG